MKKTTKGFDPVVLALTVIGSLVLLNILGLSIFSRVDLTQEKRFTLSEATKNTLGDLEDNLTVRAYFTKDLPPPANTLARDVKDLLDSYYAAGKGKLRYEFIDPSAKESDEDKEKKQDIKVDIFGRAVREATGVEQELAAQGIEARSIQVIENDEPSTRRAYRALLLSYGDKQEVIPEVGSAEGLEYEMTSLILKMSRKKAPKVAVLVGHEGPTEKEGLSKLAGLLRETYDYTEIDLNELKVVPEDVAALIVVGPKTPLSEAEQRAIDQFIMKGKSVAFLVGEVNPELRTLTQNPLDHGLTSMLSKYGVEVEKGLVLDAECAPMTVAQQRGGMMLQQQIRYPLIPLPRALKQDNPLTQGLPGVALPFISPLKIDLPEGSQTSAKAVIESSERAWVQQPPYNLDPLQRWETSSLGAPSKQTLMVTLTGPMKSAFASAATPTLQESVDPAEIKEQGLQATENARVLIAGSQSIVQDDYFTGANPILSLNLLNWLSQDEALLAVRSRQLGVAVLDKASSEARSTAKYINILGLPLLFVGFGLIRWRRREKRRATVTLS